MARLSSSVDVVESLQHRPIGVNLPKPDKIGIVGTPVVVLNDAPDTQVLVVHKNKVVHKGSTRHGKYKDVEARKEYKRDWMRKNRAG